MILPCNSNTGDSNLLYDLIIKPKEFIAIALASGLVNNQFPKEEFIKSFSLRGNIIHLKNKSSDERLAQLIADFLRKKLLELKINFHLKQYFLILPN